MAESIPLSETEHWRPSPEWLHERSLVALHYLVGVPGDLLGPAARALNVVDLTAAQNAHQGLSLIQGAEAIVTTPGLHQPFLLNSLPNSP